MKEISKEGIERLIKNGFLKNTNKGYINPKKNQPIGYYRTKGAGSHRYIEDFYSDMEVDDEEDCFFACTNE